MNAPSIPDHHQDGVHFGIPEDDYHADPALGSTDIKTLARDPAAYWWGSRMNPDRPEDEDKAHLNVGRGVHAYVLEGPEAFAQRFEAEPDPEGLLRTVDDMAAWLKENTPEAKGRITKAVALERIQAACAELGIPLPRCLPLIEAAAADAGRTILKAADHKRILAAGSALRVNPHLAGAFEGGRGEVSVFWTEQVDGEPVRRKARFDYLKPRAVVDLKSARCRDGKTFPQSCRLSLADYNYPAQAAGYMQAREQLPRLAAEGRVFGDHDADWLRRVAEAPGFGFVFVFWANAGAPQIWGTIVSIASEIQAVGEQFVREGLQNFVSARRAYGEMPWIEHWPLEELQVEDLPHWYAKTF